MAKQQKLNFGCYLLSHAISYTFTQVHILVDQSRIRKLDEVISEQVDGCPKLKYFNFLSSTIEFWSRCLNDYSWII